MSIMTGIQGQCVKGFSHLFLNIRHIVSSFITIPTLYHIAQPSGVMDSCLLCQNGTATYILKMLFKYLFHHWIDMAGDKSW